MNSKVLLVIAFLVGVALANRISFLAPISGKA